MCSSSLLQCIAAAQAYATLVVLACACVSCGTDGSASIRDNDVIEMELFDSTFVLGDDALQALVRQDPDGTLHFSGNPSSLAGVTRGSVLLAKPSAIVESGLLRLVISFEQQSEELVVRTIPTLPQLAFRKLRIEATRTIDPDPDHPGLRPMGTGSAYPGTVFDESLFDGDGDPKTEDDQVHLGGSLAAGLSYTFGLSTDWSDVTGSLDEAVKCALSLFSSCDPLQILPEIKGGFSFDAGADAKLLLDGTAFLDYEKTIALPKVTFEPIMFGPLAFFPELEVRAELEGEASSVFQLGSTISAHAQAGLSYSSRGGGSVMEPAVDKPKFEVLAAKPGLGAHSRVRVGPRLSIKLYKMFGPFASIYAFASLDSDRSQSPCYKLTAGLEGDIGMTLAIDEGALHLGLPPMSKDFGIASSVIDQGTCPLPSGAAAVDALEAFANPPFSPWAQTYGDALLHFPNEDEGAQAEWTDIVPTIDGRWIIAGSAMESLLKIDGQGNALWAHSYAQPSAWNDTMSQAELLPDRVAPTLDGGMFVSAFPYALMKLDHQGGVEWARQFDWPYREGMLRTTGLTAQPDGACLLAGNVAMERTATFDQMDAFLARFDPFGKHQWTRRLGDPNRGETVRRLVPYAGGTMILGSTWDPAGAFWTGWLAKLDAKGDLIWAREILGSDNTQSFRTSFVSGFELPDGDFIAAGTMDVKSRASLLVLKVKPDGNVGWLSVADAPDAYVGVHLSSVAPLSTSGMVAAGRFTLRNASDFWYAGLDSVGRVQWMKRFGRAGGGGELGTDPGDHNAPGVAVTRDGGLFLAGYTEGLATGANTEGLAVFQAFAKDGTLTLSNPSATTSSAMTVPLEVTAVATPWWPSVTNLDATGVSVEVTVSQRNTAVNRLSP